jgi:hypothetical protein
MWPISNRLANYRNLQSSIALMIVPKERKVNFLLQNGRGRKASAIQRA